MASFEWTKRWTEKRRPKQVEEARVRNDTEALSALGRAGAMAALENKAKQVDQDTAEDAYYAEKEAERQFDRLKETNEHIVPIDPEDEKEAA